MIKVSFWYLKLFVWHWKQQQQQQQQQQRHSNKLFVELKSFVFIGTVGTSHRIFVFMLFTHSLDLIEYVFCKQFHSLLQKVVASFLLPNIIFDYLFVTKKNVKNNYRTRHCFAVNKTTIVFLRFLHHTNDWFINGYFMSN